MTIEEEELWKKYEISKEIFERPLEMTRHEDEKAGRILASVAFLTLAASTVFSTFLNNDIKYDIFIFSQRIDLIFLFFAIFIIFIVLGTFYMLRAMGPSFEFARNRTKTEKQENDEPASIYFFEKISEENPTSWENFFKKPIKKILNKACKDHIIEARLISKKVRKKVRYINIGKFFFHIAMFIFALLLFVGFYTYTSIVEISIVVFIFTILMILFVIEEEYL